MRPHVVGHVRRDGKYPNSALCVSNCFPGECGHSFWGSERTKGIRLVGGFFRVRVFGGQKVVPLTSIIKIS